MPRSGAVQMILMHTERLALLNRRIASLVALAQQRPAIPLATQSKTVRLTNVSLAETDEDKATGEQRRT